jgi:hypothetical protein
MNRPGMLTIAIAALSILGMALAAVAAPDAPDARERDKCYRACDSKCAAEHSCERPEASRECFANFNKCKTACRASCAR